MTTLTRKEQWYGGKALADRVRKVDERYDANETNRLCCIAAVLTEIRYVPGTNVEDFQALSADEMQQAIKRDESLFLANVSDLVELLSTCLYAGKKEPAVSFLEKTMDVLEGRKPEIKENVKGINAVELSKKQFAAVKWFVKNLIPEGLTVIAGQSKIGKSWLLLQLGLCVAYGLDFIGGWHSYQNGVLYMSLEDNERRLKSRLNSINMPITERLHFKTEWQSGVQGVDRYLAQYPDVKMIMIDTWGRFSSGLLENSNDYQQVTRIAGELHSIAKRHHASVVICAHTNKGTKNEDWLDSIMGSKGLVGAADTILKLSRKREESNGTLNVTGRDVWERTLELTCAENWLWQDVDPPAPTQSERLSEFDNVPF